MLLRKEALKSFNSNDLRVPTSFPNCVCREFGFWLVGNKPHLAGSPDGGPERSETPQAGKMSHWGFLSILS